MAKDPVRGMFVEEKPDAIRSTVGEKEYFFCSTQCLNEFTQPACTRLFFIRVILCRIQAYRSFLTTPIFVTTTTDQ
ncbi:MAG: hypothetical protein WBE34_12645 [Candidatus Nitrosopolaris sp.]